ncbi:MAG: alpha/beta hydrolase [Parcubacteria group bacterium]|nr:alpha/beta hydrolase [Parcubacteria group bacterium]
MKTSKNLILIMLLLFALGSCTGCSHQYSIHDPQIDFRNITCNKCRVSLNDINQRNFIPQQNFDLYFEQLRKKHKIPNRFFQSDSQEFTQWFYSTQSPVRGVAIVVHGLNLRPSRTNQIVQFLQDKGIDVLRVTLTGHRGDFREIYQASREQWLFDMFQAYCLVLEHSSAQDSVPLYFIGYSLGGLIGLDFMTEQLKQNVRYKKMVLFAPAISIQGEIRFFASLARWFGINPLSFTPSAPSRYRRHYLDSYFINPQLPFLAYDALLSSVEAIENKRIDNLNIPTVVFIDPQDELVSFNGIDNLLKRKRLTLWRIFTVESQGSIFNEVVRNGNDRIFTVKPLHHSITDENLMGKEQWQRIETIMSNHLFSN